MRKILFLVALSVLWAGYARAQQTTGPAAEQARKEIMQFEKEKVPLLLQGGYHFSDWLSKMDAEDSLFIGHDKRRTKLEQVELWRSGNMVQHSNDQRDHKVFVYDNGNLAIVTYVGRTVNTVNGITAASNDRCVDTWVKQDGVWKRVVHINSRIPPQVDPFASKQASKSE
jgi:hypothetical protein